MRLTAELIQSANAYVNPVRERELCLRGFKVSFIENLGVTGDQFDTIDLSDNLLVKLNNFPVLKRLVTLLVNNNMVSHLHESLGKCLPKLENLILSNNQFTKLEELKSLATMPTLQRVSFLNNPVTKLENYRLFVIHLLPRLRLLDFQKVKPAERENAKKLFGKEEANAMETEEKEQPAEKMSL